MKKIIDYFVDNSVIVNLLTILILIIGTMSLFALNKETFPNVDFNFITVRTTYQGAAAEDVEKLVSMEIERELKEVDGIDELNSMSAEGTSIITLKIDPEVDTNKVLQDVRNALGDIAQYVPSEVDTPVITQSNPMQRGLIHFAILGDDEYTMRENAKYVRDVFERLPGIADVELNGYRDEVFDIQVDLEKMRAYDLTLSQVLNAIKDRQVNITAGNLKYPDREKLIRTLKENETVASLEEIVVLANDAGNTVLVKDVAQVARVLKDKTREDRADGDFAIFLIVTAKASADVLDTTKSLKDKIKQLSKDRGFRYKVFADMSYYVERRLKVLTSNGLQGIALVVVCLVLFMNLRVSLITALGAPFAFLVSFSLMDSMDITVNLISMFGLILVLGMLVDDSIIVAEQFYQYLEKGMKPKEAAKKAALDTLAPVTSTVLTTMVAFASLFFMGGIMGKFMWSVPAVVIICLFASWVECFIILPGHLADFAAKVKKAEKTRWYKPIQNAYGRFLEKALHRSGLTIFSFILIFLSSIFLAKSDYMNFELFPADDVTYSYLNIKGPVGTPIAITKELVHEMELATQAELGENEVVGVRSISGYQWSKGGTPRIGTHYGSIFIELTMPFARERSTDEILGVLSKKMKDIIDKSGVQFVFTLEKLTSGPPMGKPVNIEISGDDLEELQAVAKEIKTHLDKDAEIISAEIDFEPGKKQIIVDIDEKEARRLGVSNTQIGIELRNAFEGLEATTIKDGDEDIDVIVRLDENSRMTEETLQKIKVQNSFGRLIPLTKMATFFERQGAFMIRRFERRRTIAISAEVNRLKTTSAEMNKKIKPYLDKMIKKYPNLFYQLTGENKDTQDSLASFKKAFIGSFFVIFMLLVVQFGSLAQPFIIMTAIPFGIVGVVLSFFVFDLSLSFMGLMGILGLIGVVINDSIVLVTFINRTLDEKGYHISSLVEASVSRFRPVILTTVTTVAGLLPVAHLPDGDPFLKPMAVSFAYGLLFSTSITLLFVPACFMAYIKVMAKFNKLPEIDEA